MWSESPGVTWAGSGANSPLDDVRGGGVYIASALTTSSGGKGGDGAAGGSGGRGQLGGFGGPSKYSEADGTTIAEGGKGGIGGTGGHGGPGSGGTGGPSIAVVFHGKGVTTSATTLIPGEGGGRGAGVEGDAGEVSRAGADGLSAGLYEQK